ncbi:hypothetical protein H5410_015210 [Solanum commersonii]|uniref:Uncharacterized protein n=1 Tax=Solanum commersonii TaxID=4109 RepID=A0A9J5ZTQ6_SOLCO|nr:hypothetical protein H5410_015210 [Solanum commersonii]
MHVAPEDIRPRGLLPGRHTSGHPHTLQGIARGETWSLVLLECVAGLNASPYRRTSRLVVVTLQSPTKALRSRPQVRRYYPLSLIISISGGKETCKDSLSNRELTGNSPTLESGSSIIRNVVWRSVLS